MKNLILILTITLLGQSQANAEHHGILPGPDMLSATLNTFDMAEDLNANNLNLSGNLMINMEDKTISLFVSGGTQCSDFPICPLDYRLVLNETLPLVNVIERSDGAVVYIAEVDEMPVDGIRTRIVVESYRYVDCIMCMTKRLETVITYSVEMRDQVSGNFGENRSIMTAMPLSQIIY